MISVPDASEGDYDPQQYRSEFVVAEMDCPSEEQLIRAALAGAPEIERLEFDIPRRALTVWHREDVTAIVERATKERHRA